MASYLRPRRGKKTTAESQNIVLKRGEVFFESPTGGVGTGTGRIKVGDGTTAYTTLPYFINPDDFIAPTASGVTYNNTTSGLSATTVQGAIDEVNSSKMKYNTPHYTGVLSNDAFNTTSTDQYAKQALNVDSGETLIIGNGISCKNIVFQTRSTDIPLSNIVYMFRDQVEPIYVPAGGSTSYNFYSRANSLKPRGMKVLAGIYAGAWPMATWNAQCVLVRIVNEIENSKIEVSLQSIGQAQNYSVSMYYIYIPA